MALQVLQVNTELMAKRDPEDQKDKADKMATQDNKEIQATKEYTVKMVIKEIRVFMG